MTSYARISSDPSSMRTCEVPRSILVNSGWRTGDKVVLQFGSAKVRATLKASPDNNFRISTGLLRMLGMPGRRWHFQVEPVKCSIRFGPLIGILTTWKSTGYFRSVMKVAASLGMMAVVFRPHELHPGSKRLSAQGLVNGTMARVTVPWPDVVYNRIPNRGGEMLGATRMCKRLLSRASVPVFNRAFFHKWRIHRLLRKDERARAFLPETHPLTSVGQSSHLLRRYPMVYLKPNGGSKGQGIVRVSRVRGKGYAISFRKGHQNYQVNATSWPEAEQIIRRGMFRRTYIAQEGLSLARYRGRPFDVRVTLYKNGAGEWVPSGPAAKIAGKGCITTHVHNGGRMIPLNKALQHAFGDEAEEIKEKVKEASVELAKAVERVTKLELGELGLDIGVSSNGRVAMFEANSKPGRMIFAPSWAARDRRQSIVNLCKYSAHLAGFAVIEEA